MHLADGIVQPTALVLGISACGVAGCALALRRGRIVGPSGAAWTGTLAAFVLAAQAVNVPVLPGASAHVVGGGLLTLALGPALSIAAMSAVLLMQALLLGDGGITMIGINLFNLALIPALTVEGARRLCGHSRRRLQVAAFAGTALSSVLGALSLSAVLIQAAAAPAGLTLSWLVGVQTLSGVAEGLLTAIIVGRLWGRAPALLRPKTQRVLSLDAAALDADAEPASTATRRGLAWAAALMVVAAMLVPLATSTPDALERVVASLTPGR